MSQRVPPNPCWIPDYLQKVTTPLKYKVWAGQLHSHPDPEFANYLLQACDLGSG